MLLGSNIISVWMNFYLRRKWPGGSRKGLEGTHVVPGPQVGYPAINDKDFGSDLETHDVLYTTLRDCFRKLNICFINNSDFVTGYRQLSIHQIRIWKKNFAVTKFVLKTDKRTTFFVSCIHCRADDFKAHCLFYTAMILSRFDTLEWYNHWARRTLLKTIYNRSIKTSQRPSVFEVKWKQYIYLSHVDSETDTIWN